MLKINLKVSKNQLIKIYSKFLILIITFSYVSAYRFKLNTNFFNFDIFILIYIISITIFHSKIFVSKFTIKIILISLVIVFPSIVLLFFSNDKLGSLKFLGQYFFILTFLPLFLNIVLKLEDYDFLLKSLLFFLIIASIDYLLFWLGFKDIVYLKIKSGNRFSLGEMTPNEMGHYFVLMLFLTSILVKKSYKIILIEALAIFTYFLTSSKTVLLQIITFIIFKKKMIAINLIFIFVVVLIFKFPESIYSEISLILDDFSISNRSNTIRINQYTNVLNDIFSSILNPGYHSKLNLDSSLSVHNTFLSWLINFGFLSFILLIFFLFASILINLKNKYFRFVLFFIILDFIVLLFNPIINSRVIWFPLYIYLYTYNYKKIDV
jgi:hypothetical protein